MDCDPVAETLELPAEHFLSLQISGLRGSSATRGSSYTADYKSRQKAGKNKTKGLLDELDISFGELQRIIYFLDWQKMKRF